MPTSQALPENDPRVVAWNAYTNTEGYVHSQKCGLGKAHVDSLLWSAFVSGFAAAGNLSAADGYREIVFGEGRVKLNRVAMNGPREGKTVGLLLEPTDNPRPVGTHGNEDGPYELRPEDTVLVFRSIEGLDVLLERLGTCRDAMLAASAPKDGKP